MKKFCYLIFAISIVFIGFDVNALEINSCDSPFISHNVDLNSYRVGDMYDLNFHELVFNHGYIDLEGYDSFSNVVDYIILANTWKSTMLPNYQQVTFYPVFSHAEIDSGYTESNPDSEGNYDYSNFYLLSDYIDSYNFVIVPYSQINRVGSDTYFDSRIIPVIKFKEGISWATLDKYEFRAILGMFGIYFSATTNLHNYNHPSLIVDDNFFKSILSNKYFNHSVGAGLNDLDSIIYRNSNAIVHSENDLPTNTSYFTYGLGIDPNVDNNNLLISNVRLSSGKYYQFASNINTYVLHNSSGIEFIGSSISYPNYEDMNWVCSYQEHIEHNLRIYESTVTIYSFGNGVIFNKNVDFVPNWNKNDSIIGLNFDLSPFLKSINLIISSLTYFFLGLPPIVQSLFYLLLSFTVVYFFIRLLF